MQQQSAQGLGGLLEADVNLQDLICQTPRCALTPMSFFVSWHGVMTLVYSGFPPAVQHLKEQIRAAFPALPPENPGSKWPKTSLGCLKEGKRLMPDNLKLLNQLCSEFSQELTLSAGGPIPLDVLSIVLFQCRSLESRLVELKIDLADPVDNAAGIDDRLPSQEETNRVAKVVAATVQPDYWFAVSKDGNRETHYKDPHFGATLVYPLAFPSATTAIEPVLPRRRELALLDIIWRFEKTVESCLPGMYTWFNPPSLHVTIQALMG